jgi:hypothetical protein
MVYIFASLGGRCGGLEVKGWERRISVHKIEKRNKNDVGFEVFTAVSMKNAVFWDMAPCKSCVSRRFGGTHRLHLQGRKVRERGTGVSRCQKSAACFAYTLTLKMEATCSSETSVHTESIRRHIPEGGILQNKNEIATEFSERLSTAWTTEFRVQQGVGCVFSANDI